MKFANSLQYFENKDCIKSIDQEYLVTESMKLHLSNTKSTSL